SSSVRLYENGIELSGHARHDAIRATGRGRFSHWDEALLFATTDNSDPRANGRQYRVCCPRTLASIGRAWSFPLTPVRLTVGWLLIGLAFNPVTTASWRCRWLWLKHRTLPTLLIVALLVVSALGLQANTINVLDTTGKWIYGLAAASLLAL